MLKLTSVLVVCAAHAASEPLRPAERTGRDSVATGLVERLDEHRDLSLAFVTNAGRIEPRVRFYAHSAGAAFHFTPTEAVFTFANGGRGHRLRLTFPGANPAPRLVGRTPAAGTINELIGPAAHWRTGLAAYKEITYQDLWPGIDLAFRGENGTLKYEFHLAPGANAADIRLSYSGADRLSLDASGNLRIHTALGVLRDSRPESYQTVRGTRVPVASRYVLVDGGYQFVLGPHDPTLPLVIDPGLAYSTYLGGGGSEQGLAIALDDSGNAYITGSIFQSANFPTTAGAFDATLGGTSDAFVTKLDPSGALVYSTYLGGSGSDSGHGIAVDSVGRAYVIGTAGLDFPTTIGAFDRTGSGFFVTRLNAFGTALEYSTYLGESALLGIDIAAFRPHIAVDELGSAYVTGIANAAFPTTAGAFDTTANGNSDVFVTKLNPSGRALEYSTYLGGSSNDWGSGIAVDESGNAYVTAVTTSTNFPTTPGAFDQTFNGDRDAFVTKLNPSGSELEYSTYLGGIRIDVGVGIAVDRFGSAYVTGATTSGLSTRPCEAGCFPITLGAFDRILGGGQDAFVTKLNASGTALVYSTFLGSSRTGVGSAFDQGIAIAVDESGSAYVTGTANGPDFPVSADAVDTTVGTSVGRSVRPSACGSPSSTRTTSRHCRCMAAGRRPTRSCRPSSKAGKSRRGQWAFRRIVRAIFPWCFSPELYAARPDYIESLAGFVRSRPEQSVPDFIQQSNAVMAHDVEAELGRITAPTLMTFGRHDLVTSTRFVPRLTSAIRNSEVLVFEGCGHAPLYEHVEEFNQKTLAFLHRHAGAAA